MAQSVHGRRDDGSYGVRNRSKGHCRQNLPGSDPFSMVCRDYVDDRQSGPLDIYITFVFNASIVPREDRTIAFQQI